MTKIIVDPATCEKLMRVQSPSELCDESGNVLGQYIPTPSASACGAGPQISEDELNRRERDGGGRPLAEIIVELGRQG